MRQDLVTEPYRILNRQLSKSVMAGKHCVTPQQRSALPALQQLGLLLHTGRHVHTHAHHRSHCAVGQPRFLLLRLCNQQTPSTLFTARFTCPHTCARTLAHSAYVRCKRPEHNAGRKAGSVCNALQTRMQNHKRTTHNASLAQVASTYVECTGCFGTKQCRSRTCHEHSKHGFAPMHICLHMGITYRPTLRKHISPCTPCRRQHMRQTHTHMQSQDRDAADRHRQSPRRGESFESSNAVQLC